MGRERAAEDGVTLIAVVLDPHFDAALEQVAAYAHVWITPSSENTATVQRYRQAQHEGNAATSVTIWSTPHSGETEAEWLSILGDLDLHHSLTGPDSIIVGVRVYGAMLTLHAQSAFMAFGLPVFDIFTDGFMACRTGIG